MLNNTLLDFHNGRVIDWRGKHRDALKLAKVYNRIASRLLRDGNDFSARQFDNRANCLCDCGTSLLFGYEKDKDKLDKHLVYANFCHDRLCPTCNFLRARKNTYQLKKVMEKVQVTYDDVRFIFATFTVKNCKGSDLKAMLLRLSQAFGKLWRYKRIHGSDDTVFYGALRTTEITYNQKTNTYHAHLHVLFAVKEQFFDKNSNYYINQDEWIKLWQKAMKIDYLPSVYVNVIKSRNGHYSSLDKALVEVVKYQTKEADYLNIADGKRLEEVVYTLAMALKGTRSYSLSGVFKQIKSQLFGNDCEDESNDDLIHVDDSNSCIANVENIIFVQYRYQNGDFYEVELENNLVAYVLKNIYKRRNVS